MTTHAQPIQVLVPGVSPFVGDAPVGRHAERVVREADSMVAVIKTVLPGRQVRPKKAAEWPKEARKQGAFHRMLSASAVLSLPMC